MALYKMPHRKVHETGCVQGQAWTAFYELLNLSQTAGDFHFTPRPSLGFHSWLRMQQRNDSRFITNLWYALSLHRDRAIGVLTPFSVDGGHPVSPEELETIVYEAYRDRPNDGARALRPHGNVTAKALEQAVQIPVSLYDVNSDIPTPINCLNRRFSQHYRSEFQAFLGLLKVHGLSGDSFGASIFHNQLQLIASDPRIEAITERIEDGGNTQYIPAYLTAIENIKPDGQFAYKGTNYTLAGPTSQWHRCENGRSIRLQGFFCYTVDKWNRREFIPSGSIVKVSGYTFQRDIAGYEYPSCTVARFEASLTSRLEQFISKAWDSLVSTNPTIDALNQALDGIKASWSSFKEQEIGLRRGCLGLLPYNSPLIRCPKGRGGRVIDLLNIQAHQIIQIQVRQMVSSLASPYTQADEALDTELKDIDVEEIDKAALLSSPSPYPALAVAYCRVLYEAQQFDTAFDALEKSLYAGRFNPVLVSQWHREHVRLRIGSPDPRDATQPSRQHTRDVPILIPVPIQETRRQGIE